ncbi:hypothetical protein ACFVFQ_04020 [Streptomyces sp. NPDC057743]|uniref:hypothetical protein n=1 Tax=Streptomyces sp. NPDC057743 TaxID=3346236 RepID=UPI0036AAEA61
MLNDNDVLAAVRQHIIERGDPSPVEQPSAAKIRWRSLLEGEVLRCIETHREQERFHPGHIDLSDRPEYDILQQHPLDAPQELAAETTVTMVKRGTVKEETCPCGNGKVACPRCQGRGAVQCDPSATCTDCPDTDPCLCCHGTRTRSKGLPDDHEQERKDRTTCKLCGALDAACPTCRGRGKVTCSTCQGRGSFSCPDCDRVGTVPHERCAGTGHTVSWIEGTIRRQPRTEEVKRSHSGVSFVARKQARDNGKWATASLMNHDAVPDDLDAEFKKLLRPHLKRRKDEIAREATFRYLPLARVEVPHQPHRIYYVFPGKTRLEVLPLPSPQRTWRIVGAVLAVALVVYLIVHLVS